MLNFFLSTLSVRVRQAEQLVGNDRCKGDLLDEVSEGLTNFGKKNLEGTGTVGYQDSAWNEAYRLEKLMALAEPSKTLQGEINRRLEEAADEGVVAAARLRARFERVAASTIDNNTTPPSIKAGGDEMLRSFLLDVLEETQYHMYRKHSMRPEKKNAAAMTATFGLIAFALMLLPFIIVYIKVAFGYEPLFKTWSWLPLYIALTAGLFGAFFSRLQFLQANWNNMTFGEVKDAQQHTSIMLRACVGMTGSVIVFFFLQSGVVTGSLFPKFSELALDQLHYPALKQPAEPGAAVPLRLMLPNVQLALLIVWSFLAGFSERLVPSILQSSESRITTAPN